jgi:hypothetical protein
VTLTPSSSSQRHAKKKAVKQSGGGGFGVAKPAAKTATTVAADKNALVSLKLLTLYILHTSSTRFTNVDDDVLYTHHTHTTLALVGISMGQLCLDH